MTRNTRQKDAIRTVIEEAERPLALDEVLALARGTVEGLSIATVYRNVGQLVREGWLAPVALPGETTRYERAGKAHHHHFHCTGCDKVFEVPGCNLRESSKLPRGFRTTGHDVLLYGFCNHCA
jgi:Fur family ferric uptake transcriptional regulator